MEDFRIKGTAALDSSDIFIESDFNLRIVNFSLFVKDREYRVYKDLIEKNESIFETEALGDLVFLKGNVRTYFSVGFAYSPRTSECSGFSVLDLNFR